MTPEQERGAVATGYAREKLECLLRDLDNYNAGELWRQMARIAEGATGIPHAESLARELDEQKVLCQKAESRLAPFTNPPSEAMIVAGQRYIHSYDVSLIFEAMRDEALRGQKE